MGASSPAAASGYGYSGPLNMNTRLVDYPNGAKVPADEPAVAAARRAHLNARDGVSAYEPAVAAARAAHLNKKAGITVSAPYGALVSHSNGAVVPAMNLLLLLHVLHILTRFP